jgi:hypothetical protein
MGGCLTVGFAAAGPLLTGIAAIGDRIGKRAIPADQAERPVVRGIPPNTFSRPR